MDELDWVIPYGDLDWTRVPKPELESDEEPLSNIRVRSMCRAGSVGVTKELSDIEAVSKPACVAAEACSVVDCVSLMSSRTGNTVNAWFSY